jgi:hypothetical protein
LLDRFDKRFEIYISKSVNIMLAHSGKFRLFTEKIQLLLIGNLNFGEFFLKMQVISLAFRMAIFGNPTISCWVCKKEQKSGMPIFSRFS